MITKGFYNIPKEVIDDISKFQGEVDKFNAGEVDASHFKPYRVSRGIYSQRGQTHYMVRIKVPGGLLTPEQMIKIAELSKKYGNGVPHVTNRQDFQIHYVALDDVSTILNELLSVSLTSKGGGGSTLRNITASPLAGIDKDDVFDVSAYPLALTEYFLVNPKSYALPRKFKITFAGSYKDDSYATMHDVGFIATIKDGKEGFKLYGAGGMGAISKTSILLEEFVPKEEVHIYSEALLNLFDKHGNRRNKHKARMRFLVDRHGVEGFTKLYNEELQAVKSEGRPSLVLPVVEHLRTPQKPSGSGKDISSDAAGFSDWFHRNVYEQKQDGYYYAILRLTIGDIESDKLFKLAEVVKSVGNGSVRNTQKQNIVVPYLTQDELPVFYNSLKEIGLADKGADGVEDIMCCPGAETCNLGICLSKPLSIELKNSIEASGMNLVELKDININVSGCPNSCGQHPVGAIGLYGVARGKGHKAPHYNVLVGGRVEEGKTRLGTISGYVPSKNIPLLINEMLTAYISNRTNSEESYQDYLDRVGFEDTKVLVKKHSELPSFDDDKSFYVDWGASEEFSLAGLGPGECGVGVFDLVETDMNNARATLDSIKVDIDGGINPEDLSENLHNALITATKSLLITQGVEPKNDEEALSEFERLFVTTGILDDEFKNLQKKSAQFNSGLLDGEGVKNGADFVLKLLDEINRLYDLMDDTLKFTGEIARKLAPALSGGESRSTGDESPKTNSDAFMDLKGVACPINYVKAKIKMETMSVGQTLLLYLDDGEPIRNVPNSLKNDGQEILQMDNKGTYFELLVKKAV